MDDDAYWIQFGIGFNVNCNIGAIGTADLHSWTTMDEKNTESAMVDLYEEMLYERAAMGIRPVLYISSQTDLECSVLMLLDEPLESKLALPEHLASTRGNHQLMTSYSRLRRGTG